MLADPTLKIKVILEDPNFLVVEKPAGVPVYPLREDEKGTLIQGLLNQFPEILQVGKQKFEGGAVHRLDNDTSGLLLIARNQKTYEFFRNEFKNRRVEKEYLALVMGRMEKNRLPFNGKINLPIEHHPKNKRKMKVLPSPLPLSPRERVSAGGGRVRGREAITLFSVEKNFNKFTLLRVKIPTGVRHQIRAHLAYIGFPIVGDILYGGEKGRVEGLNRFFLHATRLKFRDPKNKKWIVCESKLSADLRKLLSTFST